MTETQLQQHPLSAAYPKMDPKDFDALVADIAAHGQLHDCVTLDGMVLDGMTRYRACLAAGIECRFVEYDGTDPRAYVESVNGHRRHLAYWQRVPAQRAVAAVLECESWSARGRPKQLGNAAELNTAPELGEPKERCHVAPLTTAQLAEKAGVSTRTIKRARAAVRAGHGEAVSAGKMTANQAAKQAKPPKPPKRSFAPPEPAEQSERDKILIDKLRAENDQLHDQFQDMRAELIELRAASMDECLRNLARDEIAGLREALALEQQLHAGLKAQRETVEHQINVWKNQCAYLERKNKALSKAAPTAARAPSAPSWNDSDDWQASQAAAMDAERDAQRAYFVEGARC